MRGYLLIMLVAAAVAYLMTPMVRRLAERKLVFAPLRDRDVHKVPTPRLGGVAMLCGVLVAFAVASQMPFLQPIFSDSNLVLGVLGAAVLLCVLGVVDDIWDLNWITKLAGQVLAAGFMAINGVSLVSLPVNGLFIASSRTSMFLTIFVVVLTINAINFVDGLDGLAAGVVAIGGSAFFLYTYYLAIDANQNTYANLASLIIASLVGACIGFLPHNFNPAHIFMGDSGSMLIGLLLAGSAIRVTGQVDPALISQERVIPTFLPVLLPVAVLILPLTDLALAVIRRLRAGKSPFSADAKHLHHRMLGLGHTHARAVLIMYLWVAIVAFGCVAFLMVSWRIVVPLSLGLAIITLVLTFSPLRRKLRQHQES
ncbi:MraY family glycosyltransferase [Saxibacter everestensis]|uniref:MraY family glycosyltransferase n=1 Tax=Saxibacter everestensis TaxID=2909229 RepID=A0ABY8QNF2_9MICO|nr:MraY family glycosyltransferase [Brevibacteriaceae bacterium ZFBP1038]